MAYATRGLRFASLFSGCGGFDLGFVQAGFKCVAAFDIDPLAVQVYNRNVHPSAVLCDLSDSGVSLQALSGVDVLLAGSPCQGFSTAGKRSLDDPRNKLLLLAGRIACKVRPAVFVAENVTGVTAGEHGRYWKSLRRTLRAGGYKTTDIRVEATRSGLAQIRTRVLMLAWRGGREITVELPVAPGRVLRDALAGMDGAPNHIVRPLAPGSDLARIAKCIKPGQKLCNVRGGANAVHTWDIPAVFGHVTEAERRLLETLLRLRRRQRIREYGDADPVTGSVISREFGASASEVLDALIRKRYVRNVRRRYDLTHTFNGKFRRLRWDRASPTVDTRFGDPRYFLHPDEARGFTVREAARIQGFPDTFVFCGTERDQYRLVGNAVPPPLAKCLGECVRKVLLG